MAIVWSKITLSNADSALKGGWICIRELHLNSYNDLWTLYIEPEWKNLKPVFAFRLYNRYNTHTQTYTHRQLICATALNHLSCYTIKSVLFTLCSSLYRLYAGCILPNLQVPPTLTVLNGLLSGNLSFHGLIMT